jgi:large subunit ribosomal protein L4
MMELAVNGGSKINVSDEVFGRDFSETLVHQAVIAYLAGSRSGTKAQKNRAAVSGGGRKPWRQKGTGNARAGTIRSPIWRGGGVTFAAKPRDFSQKLNKKQYRSAMKTILSELVRQERLIILDELSVAEPKTKAITEKFAALGIERDSRCLIVDAELNENVYLSARNVKNVSLLAADRVDPVSLVNADQVLMTRAAVESIQEWLS